MDNRKSRRSPAAFFGGKIRLAGNGPRCPRPHLKRAGITQKKSTVPVITPPAFLSDVPRAPPSCPAVAQIFAAHAAPECWPIAIKGLAKRSSLRQYCRQAHGRPRKAAKTTQTSAWRGDAWYRAVGV